MQVFYTPDITTTPFLPADEARHALRVLRLTEGDDLCLTDGKGCFYQAVIRQADVKHCAVDIVAQRRQPPLRDFRLHIALAPTKNMERTEWLCEKATEIGVDAITLLHCRFSERREAKTERLEKILVSAMKQSGQAVLPQLNGMTAFRTFVERPFSGQAFIAHCAEGEKPLLQHLCRPRTDTLILIGPEGDFSPEEIQMATARGFAAISLGKSRLRTETAALVACHTAHLVNGELRMEN
jgi:16S rRNA (uracil1498-N3)-methyltransferase